MYFAAAKQSLSTIVQGTSSTSSRILIDKGAAQPLNSNATQSPATVDLLRKAMRKGNIAYVVPSPMTVDKPETIRLTLSYDKLSEEIRRTYTQGGIKGGQNAVPTSRTMTARLCADDKIKIVSKAEQTKPVSESSGTEWTWEVTPKQDGLAVVEITLVAYGIIDGEKVEDPFVVFSDVVAITLKEQKFSESVSQWLKEVLHDYAKETALTALGAVTLAGWTWLKRKKKPKG